MWHPDFGGDFTAKTTPTSITAALRLIVVSSQLWVTLKELQPFTVLLKPTGSVSEKIISALAWLVVEPIVAAVVPVASAVIRDISFVVARLPEFSIDLEGVSVRAVAENVGMRAAGTGIELFGRIDVSIHPTKPAALPTCKQESEATASPPTPATVPNLLYAGAAAGQTLAGGLYFAGNYIRLGGASIESMSETAISVSGDFKINEEIDGDHIDAAGSFTADLVREDDTDWNGRIKAKQNDGTTIDWSTKFEGGMVNGTPTFTAVIDAGSPVPVQLTLQVTDGKTSYVYAFPQITGSNAQPLPAGYVQFPPPTSNQT